MSKVSKVSSLELNGDKGMAIVGILKGSGIKK